MHLRQLEGKTLADIANKVGATTDKKVDTTNEQIVVDITDRGCIEVEGDDGEPILIPATSGSILALGNWLLVPSKFLGRQEGDLQQHILNTLLARTPGDGVVVYDEEEGIRQVLDPQQKIIDPRELIEIMMRVIDPTAEVSDFWSNPNEFRLDVMAPEGFDRGIGGDPQVGDITRGGIRVHRDVAHNQAPSVQPWMFRLECTNGMEIEDEGLKVEARGGSVEEVLEELEEMAERAFGDVEGYIKAFYDLRSVRVENPERTLARMGEEQGLPSRTIVTLVEQLPEVIADDGSASMFDLANSVTNLANEPRLRKRSGVRRTLERAGGRMVVAHVARCRHCQSRLVAEKPLT